MEKGRAEGLAEGEARGKAEEASRIASNLVSLGLDATLVSKMTGLGLEEIAKLHHLTPTTT